MKRGAVLLLALAACGPQAAIFLKVEAPLVVPDACDALHVTASRAGAQIFDHTYALKEAFPATLTLTTNNDADLGDAGVSVTVEARKGDYLAQPWSHASGQVVMQQGQLVPLTIRICDCP